MRGYIVKIKTHERRHLFLSGYFSLSKRNFFPFGKGCEEKKEKSFRLSLRLCASVWEGICGACVRFGCVLLFFSLLLSHSCLGLFLLSFSRRFSMNASRQRTFSPTNSSNKSKEISGKSFGHAVPSSFLSEDQTGNCVLTGELGKRGGRIFVLCLFGVYVHLGRVVGRQQADGGVLLSRDKPGFVCPCLRPHYCPCACSVTCYHVTDFFFLPGLSNSSLAFFLSPLFSWPNHVSA